MTRDSKVWLAVIVLSILTGLPAHFNLLHEAFPSLPQSVDAQIELLAWAAGLIAAKMSMSPLGISKEGRIAAIRADPDSPAPTSALKAADAAEQAVVATSVAETAAAVAHDEAVKKEENGAQHS